MNNQKKILYLDFDGTVVEFDYPKIGKLNEGCVEVIKWLREEKNYKVILNSYRSDLSIRDVKDALNFCKENGITIDNYVYKKIEPIPFKDNFLNPDIIFIDDIAKDTPLINAYNGKLKVCWKTVFDELKNNLK